MSHDRSPAERPKKTAAAARPAYEPPRIAWVESYEPMGFGVSCVKVEGSPACLPGPIINP